MYWLRPGMQIYTFLVLLLVSAFPIPTVAVPASSSSLSARTAQSRLPLPVHVIHEFPLGTFVENLAVRRNGQILVTIVTAPELYQVDPLKIRAPILIHTFSNATTLLGIVEVDRDVFYVAVGSIDFQKIQSIPGSFSIYKVDMTTFSILAHTTATITKVADFPDSITLNGLTLLDREAGLILIADSGAGAVLRLNVRTGEIRKVLEDPLMAPTSIPGNGVNGIKIRDGALFWTNNNAQTFNRIPIHPDGTTAGTSSTLASGIAGDDFVFNKRGDAFIAQNAWDNLVFLRAGGGSALVIAGSPNSTVLAGPSACQFGRTLVDRKSLYVTTNGGLAGYFTGNFRIGGTVSRIDVGDAGY